MPRKQSRKKKIKEKKKELLEQQKKLKDTSSSSDEADILVESGESVSNQSDHRKETTFPRQSVSRYIEYLFQVTFFDKELGVPTHPILNVNQVYRAAEALLDYKEKSDEQDNGKKSLFDDPDYVQLIITMKMVPNKSKKIPYLMYGLS